MSASLDSMRAALDGVLDPCSISAGVELGIVSMGLVEALQVGDDGSVVVRLRLTSLGCLMGVLVFEPEIKQILSGFPGVTTVTVTHGDPLTWTEDAITPEGRRRLADARSARRHRTPAPARG